jgi:type II secretory pathway pseudopilin PulG
MSWISKQRRQEREPQWQSYTPPTIPNLQLPEYRRRSFRLIEVVIVLVIVLAIAGIFFSVLCGSHSRVREASARINCTNNIRALGIGMNNYYCSSLYYPTGKSNTTGKSFYYTIRQQMDVPVTTNGPAPAVAQYMCPSRRSPSTVGTQAPADYGYAKGSLLDSAEPIKQKEIRDGIGNTILLGHIAIRPEDYGGGPWDGPWDTNAGAYVRLPAPLYLDKDAPDSVKFMGSPHPSAVPACFCDNSVRTIDYDWSQSNPEMLRQAWQYNRKRDTLKQVIGNQ